MNKAILTFLLFGCLYNTVHAGGFVVDSDTQVRGLTMNQDDVTTDQDPNLIKLSAEQKHQAAVWNLTDDEEKRYLFLMQNKSGQYWANGKLTPVEILGMNARNSTERQHFAQLYAEQSQQRIAKQLAWATIATNAKKSLNKGTPMVRTFDVTPYSPYSQQTVLKAGDKLFLLTSLSTESGHIMSVLLSQLATVPFQLNIYFADKPNSKALQTWATSQNIPIDSVKKGRVTLNNTTGPFNNGADQKTLPQLILARDGKSERVDLSRF